MEDNEKERKEKLLLEEYKLCQDSTKKIESTIWQTGGLLGLGSLGSFVALTVGKAIQPASLLVGLFIVIILCIWWRMAKRWWDIQHTTFIRITHLEEKLDFFQTRYIRYRDRNSEGTDIPLKNKKLLKCFFNEEQIEMIKKKNNTLAEEINKVSITEFIIRNLPITRGHLCYLRLRMFLKHEYNIIPNKLQKKGLRREIKFPRRGVQESLRWLPIVALSFWLLHLAYFILCRIGCIEILKSL